MPALTTPSIDEFSTAPTGAAPTGAATMSPGMRDAVRYARYLYDCVKAHLTPPVLEIGCGFGTYTEMLLRHGPVVSVDINPDFLDDLRERFRDQPLTTEVLDLNDHAAIRRLSSTGFRSAFSTNVFEHIEDDHGALKALHDASGPEGTVCLIVPAHPALYGYMDTQAGHFRRYTRRTLTQTLEQAGWKVRKSFYINALGGFGWWVNQRCLPAKPLDSARVNTQLVLYDRVLVPVARLTDWMFRRFFGLSVVAIAGK